MNSTYQALSMQLISALRFVAAAVCTCFCALAHLFVADAEEYTDSSFYLDYGGPSGDPFSLLKVGDYVYMGGGFLNVEGNIDMKNLARFDLKTEQWEQVPGIDRNFENFVRVLTRDTDGTLLVGGDFTRVNGVVARKIARFNQYTNTWSPLVDLSAGDDSRGPVAGNVYGLAATEDYIYIGGFGFNHADAAWRFIRRYHKQTRKWGPVGAGLDDRVSALVTDGDRTIYAGGGFRKSGSKDVRSLAKWTGLTWSEVGGGVDGDVRALAMAPNGTLYVGGQFTAVGGLAAGNVAAWDGSSWDVLDGGVKGGGNVNGIYGMSIDGNGRVYIAGDFDTTADGTNLNKVAVWDGSGKWKALGSGLGKSTSQIVNTVFAAGNDAYFGGVFADPNGSPNVKKNFARWNPESSFTDLVLGVPAMRCGTRAVIVNGKMELSWRSVPGTNYVLQASANHRLQNWSTVSDPVIGDGGRWKFTISLDAPQKYYRLLAVKP